MALDKTVPPCIPIEKVTQETTIQAEVLEKQTECDPIPEKVLSKLRQPAVIIKKT
jgi:hypothetical protein